MNEEMQKDETFSAGTIVKEAQVETQDVTDEDLRKINKFTLSPLTADDVFTFKVIAGDNELDDRNYEPFNLNALKDLKKLYIGKTVIKDHRRLADNQVARIYDTELVAEPKTTGAGEAFTKLICKCYMVKTDSNADLIKEIKAGIKREVSTGCVPKKAICSICGVDNMKSYCAHWNGREYDTPNGKKVCYFTLDGAKEAYELSLVAVPAQPRAATTKHYMDNTAQKCDTEPQSDEKLVDVQKDVESENDATEANLVLKCRAIEAYLYAENKNHEEE